MKGNKQPENWEVFFLRMDARVNRKRSNIRLFNPDLGCRRSRAPFIGHSAESFLVLHAGSSS